MQSLLEYAEEALLISDNLVDVYNAKCIDLNTAQIVLMTIVAKSRASAKAFILLVKKGYKNDSQCILRSILENIVSVRYIFKQKKARLWAERFIEYQKCGTYKYAIKYLKYGKDTLAYEGIMKEKQKIKEEILELEKKYGNNFNKYPYTWSGKKLSEMAYDCGMEFHYDVLYSIWSDFSHSNIQGLNDFVIKIEDDELLFVESIGLNATKELVAFVDLMVILNDLF